MFAARYFAPRYFAPRYWPEGAAVSSVGATTSTTFPGFGGGFVGPDGRPRKGKAKRRKKEEEEHILPAADALQAALRESVARNAPPIPAAPILTRRRTQAGPVAIDPAIARNQQLDREDEELLVILRHL